MVYIEFECKDNPAMADAVNRMFYNLSRTQNLCKIYKDSSGGKKGRKSVHAADLLRAAVVLNHAALEDSLRTISSYFIPLGDKESINKIPLSGINNSGRPEKFHLGELLNFKEDSVSNIIQRSVNEYLERLTFNNLADVSTALISFGLEVKKFEDFFPDIEKMIKRRHQIVHRGDRVEKSGRGKQYADTIRLTTVERWLKQTLEFVARVAFSALGKSKRMTVKKARLTIA